MRNLDTILRQLDQAIRAVQTAQKAEIMLDSKLPYNRAKTALQKARGLLRSHYYVVEDALAITEKNGGVV